MKAKDLVHYDSSFTLIHQNIDEDFLGICPVDETRPHHILFIKDMKFWNRFFKTQKAQSKSEVGLIIEKKFFQVIQKEFEAELKSLAFVGSVDSIDLSISYLSWPFYELKYSQRNLLSDGRLVQKASIDPSAQIAPNVFIGENVRIGKNTVIHSGCSIMHSSEVGDETILYPNVTLYPDVKIGKHCRIHANSTLGADGFGYNFKDGIHHKVWHVGGVIVEDDVEIGANSSVDAGTFSPTRIGQGTKIDNLVQIGHNNILGKGVILCGQVGLSGSVILDDFVVLGGKAGVAPGVHIGKGSQIAGAGLVSNDCEPGSVLAGHPARALKEWLKSIAVLRKLALNQNQKE